jgi:undecaprenyl diphosphate synthase
MSDSLKAQFEQIPQHIAIIMDGNGRWAKNHNLPRIEGHRQGVRNVELVLQIAAELELEAMTLFAFSSENWKRPKEEVDALMNILERFLKNKENLLHKHSIRLKALGRIEELPATIIKLLHKVENATKDYPRTLGLALNYGSRIEVVDAVKRYLSQVEAGIEAPADLCWEKFATFLYTAGLPDPDLIIRTSGETRLSNFLLLQGAYAEIYYSSVNWPDFGRDEFTKALKDFKGRERRFGLTSEQIKQEIR